MFLGKLMIIISAAEASGGRSVEAFSAPADVCAELKSGPNGKFEQRKLAGSSHTHGADRG